MIVVNFDIPAGVVHGVLWFSLVLTIISAVLNTGRAIQYRDRAVAPMFLPRGVLSVCYAFVYALRLSQPVKDISDPTTMLALTLGVAAWSLVWIMPAALYRPTPTPMNVIEQIPDQ